jgi:hypothetical protein
LKQLIRRNKKRREALGEWVQPVAVTEFVFLFMKIAINTKAIDFYGSGKFYEIKDFKKIIRDRLKLKFW